MELHPNFQEDPAFLCSFGQLRGCMQYSTLPRLETHSVIFPARVICSSSFFSAPLSLIFNYCVPERQSTKTPCPTSHQWDELPQPCDMPCTIPPSHLLFARFFHKTHLPCAPPILHKIVPKSLRARTPPSLAFLHHCLSHTTQLGFVLSSKVREADLPPPPHQSSAWIRQLVCSCVWPCPRNFYPKNLVEEKNTTVNINRETPGMNWVHWKRKNLSKVENK